MPLPITEINMHTPNWVLLDEAIKEGCTDLVFFDDASYGGSQLKGGVKSVAEFLNRGFPNKKFNLHIVVPFATDLAQQRILEAVKDNIQINLFFHVQEIMLTIQEIIEGLDMPQSEKAPLLADISEYCGYLSPNSLTLTYFQHKVPDSVSFSPAIRYGMVDFGGDPASKKGKRSICIPFISEWQSTQNGAPYKLLYISELRARL